MSEGGGSQRTPSTQAPAANANSPATIRGRHLSILVVHLQPILPELPSSSLTLLPFLDFPSFTTHFCSDPLIYLIADSIHCLTLTSDRPISTRTCQPTPQPTIQLLSCAPGHHLPSPVITTLLLQDASYLFDAPVARSYSRTDRKSSSTIFLHEGRPPFWP